MYTSGRLIRSMYIYIDLTNNILRNIYKDLSGPVSYVLVFNIPIFISE